MCVYTYIHISIYIERETGRESDSNLSQILSWHKAVKETEKVLALVM